jgi:hypothetical protein
MKTVSPEPERRGRPWPAPSVNGSPSTDGQWWRGGAEPFPLWPTAETRETPIVPAASPVQDTSPERETPPMTAVAPEQPEPAPVLVTPFAALPLEARPIEARRILARRPVAARTPPPREPRHPAVGLAALVTFALLAGFFSWVSAEPFWLALGHSRAGTATVSSCTGTGIGSR